MLLFRGSEPTQTQTFEYLSRYRTQPMLWLKAARERLKKFKFQLTAEGPKKKAHRQTRLKKLYIYAQGSKYRLWLWTNRKKVRLICTNYHKNEMKAATVKEEWQKENERQLSCGICILRLTLIYVHVA